MDVQDSSTSKQPPELCIDMSPKEMVTEQPSQGMSSKDMETDQASQDCHKTTKEGREERSSNGMVALDDDWDTWLDQKQKLILSGYIVQPRAVVNDNYRSLFKAAVEGDWEKIEKSLNENDAAMTAAVMNVKGEEPFTILDVAITAAQDQLVENLVKHKQFPPNRKDLHLDYAFLHAARAGRIRMVKALIGKIDAKSPIIHVALEQTDQKEVVWHLVRQEKLILQFQDMIGLLLAGYLDICLYIAHKCPELVCFEESKGVTFLEHLAITTLYFQSAARPNFWKRSIYNLIPVCMVDTSFDYCEDTKMARALNWFKILWNLLTIPAPFIKSIGELKLTHYCSLELAKLALTEMAEKKTREMPEFLLTSRVVLDAASRGIYEIVKLCLERFPELMWDHSFAKQLMNEIVKGRHVELFRLVSAYKPLRRMADDDISTKIDPMEAVTEWSPTCVPHDVSGAAFLMQRELQWFQALEVGGYPSFKWLKFQAHRKSYWEVFVEQRKELVKEAGQWMKDTSSSCSVVAALIITIAFAAAFTVPGGNDNSTGIPTFLWSRSFMAFAVADALALFCSVTAAMMFLAILTSRYAIEDFCHSLPRKMVLGLTFLFLSLAFMLAAFGSALWIVLSERLKWIYIPITLLAAFPAVLFAILQLPLYIEMVESTFRPRLYRPLKLRK